MIGRVWTARYGMLGHLRQGIRSACLRATGWPVQRQLSAIPRHLPGIARRNGGECREIRQRRLSVCIHITRLYIDFIYIYTVYYTRIIRTYVHLCKHVFTLNTPAQCFPAEGGWAALRRHPADPSGAGYSGQEGWLARLPFIVA